MESTTITGPSVWASALINGDESGLDDEDIKAMEVWLETNAGWSIVGIVEDSERFTWSYRLHGGTASGGEVCDYIALKQ